VFGSSRARTDDALHGAVGAARRPVIALRADLKVTVAAQPVDFRKSVHTLSALMSEALRANPYCGDVFVFRSERSDRVKLLAWDGGGMVLLHQGSFTWPPMRDGLVHLSATQLARLLDGYDWTRVSPQPVRQPARLRQRRLREQLADRRSQPRLQRFHQQRGSYGCCGPTHQESFRARRGRVIPVMLLGEPLLDGLEQAAIEDRWMLSRADLAPEDHLANIEPVAQEGSALIIAPDDGLVAGKSAVPRDHREKLPRQREAVSRLATANPDHVAGSMALLKSCGPGETRIVSGNRKVSRTRYSGDGGSGGGLARSQSRLTPRSARSRR
jgi:transposase